MAVSLAEYAKFLDDRDLMWPRVPPPVAVQATPFIKPLDGIRIVLWDVYGTLLRTTGGTFCLVPDPQTSLEVALEKTIYEFNMWNSMYRKPGPPWKSMINIFVRYHKRLSMAATKRHGDLTDPDLVDIWEAIITRLFDKNYSYDKNFYGDIRQYSEKVAYFFHSNLQGVEARPGAVQAMQDLHAIEIRQGVLADGQVFSFTQMLRALTRQGKLPPLAAMFHPDAVLFSYELGIRKPSRSLFELTVERLKAAGFLPEQILHISCRMEADLKPAKAIGMRTALLAAEKTGLEARSKLLKDSATRPDRLLTDLSQVATVFGII
ncbi:MAG: HAD family hydrolase [Fuerstiella sp.]|nr:HAD family hydrolase [Fuerstiella sp.]